MSEFSIFQIRRCIFGIPTLWEYMIPISIGEHSVAVNTSSWAGFVCHENSGSKVSEAKEFPTSKPLSFLSTEARRASTAKGTDSNHFNWSQVATSSGDTFNEGVRISRVTVDHPVSRLIAADAACCSTHRAGVSLLSQVTGQDSLVVYEGIFYALLQFQ